MNNKLAEEIAELISHADSGCSNCVSALADKAEEKWPGFDFYNRTMRYLYPDWDKDANSVL